LHANLHNLHHRKLTNSLKVIVLCKTYWPQVSDESLLPWPSLTQLDATVVLTSWSNFVADCEVDSTSSSTVI
jgi:hypothetical protein